MDTDHASPDARTLPTSPGSRSSAFANYGPSKQYKTSQDGLGITREYSTSPNAGRKLYDPFGPSAQDLAELDTLLEPPSIGSALLIRKLSMSMSNQTLQGMLLFAQDVIDTDFFAPGTFYRTDGGYQTALARFATEEGALYVRNRLHGKLNAAGSERMIFEIIKGVNPPLSNNLQRTASDAHTSRLSTSASSGGSSHGRPSRFSNQFQSMDQRASPTRRSRLPGALDLSNTDGAGSANMQTLFSPISPTRSPNGRDRVTSRSIIGDDVADDETQELFQNPRAFAEGDHRARNPSQTLTSQLGGLKLETDSDGGHSNNNGHPLMSPISGFSPARTMPQMMQSPNTDYSSSFGFSPTSPNEGFSPQYPRHQLPPANPADQNPPCNTLYVGNLPVDTSEDELKAVFSKQRGYKRLCFRTKHNGPMCFVEFEDVSFATKALKDLYGHMLHNSVKGGIRLSFSKNPLGVRKDQMSMHSPMSPMGQGYGGFGSPGFSTANGPPPGLTMPPGFNGPLMGSPNSRNDVFCTTSGNGAQAAYAGSQIDGFQEQYAHPYINGSRGYPSIGGTFEDPDGRH